MDAMRTDVAEFEHPLRKKFPLGIQVPFIRQWNGELFVQPGVLRFELAPVAGLKKRGVNPAVPGGPAMVPAET